MLRRDHLKGLGTAVVCAGGVYGLRTLADDDEDDENTSPQDRNIDELQNGEWSSNVEFESPIKGLDAYVYRAGTESQERLQSSIEIRGGFEYLESNLIEITGMELRWMIGESAVQEESSVEFESPIALSNNDNCGPSLHSRFGIRVSVSGIRGADRLIITVPESEVSISKTC